MANVRNKYTKMNSPNWFGLSFVSNFSCTRQLCVCVFVCMRSLIPEMPYYNLATHTHTHTRKNASCCCLLLVICTLSLCFVLFLFILLVQAKFLHQQQQHGHILPEVTLSYVRIFYTHSALNRPFFAIPIRSFVRLILFHIYAECERDSRRVVAIHWAESVKRLANLLISCL